MVVSTRDTLSAEPRVMSRLTPPEIVAFLALRVTCPPVASIPTRPPETRAPLSRVMLWTSFMSLPRMLMPTPPAPPEADSETVTDELPLVKLTNIPWRVPLT